MREGAVILFLGLRGEEPEEFYHRNPTTDGDATIAAIERQTSIKNLEWERIRGP